MMFLHTHSHIHLEEDQKSKNYVLRFVYNLQWETLSGTGYLQVVCIVGNMSSNVMYVPLFKYCNAMWSGKC